ncbi:MAG: endolytic transglycosylase MltG [Actinomycetota bacterium]
MDESTPDRDTAVPTERRPRRAALLVALVLFLVVVAAVAVVGNRYRTCRTAPDATGETVTFEVPEGASGQDVVESLAAEGLIRCGGFVGDLMLRGSGKAGDILAGTYALPVGSSLDEMLVIMTTPPPPAETVELAIAEGLQIDSDVPGKEDIANAVADQLGLSEKRFIRLAESGRFSLPPYLKKGQSLEGFLFPAIYEFRTEGLTEKVVIEGMLARFQQEAEALDLQAEADRLGMTPYEVVTLASMIEKEYRVADEGPLISGVIHNRLEVGMPLGIDATLLYDDPTPDGELSSSDLESDTPYNTRLVAGLPPTPIASPGGRKAGALLWALHPESTPFLYYVLCPQDGDGVHRFSETYDEHLANVEACLG